MPALEDGNPQLIQKIKNKILERGKIPFRDFMQTALYAPHLGYYTSGREIWGERGDYLTSPSIHPVFGMLICRQIFEMWDILGRPGEFTLIEAGTGSALLSEGILEYSKSLLPEFYKSINPVIIEKNPVCKKDGSQFSWYSSLEEVKRPVTGCIISNELIDAFPVHVVVNDNGVLKEVYVGFKNDRFAEVLDTPSTPEIEKYLEDVLLANGQRIEINLEAVKYIKTAANILEKGFVITIDYGLPAGEFYNRFTNGSLLCYYRHKISDNVYERVGCQDITSHVDFTGLARCGKESGFEVTGFTTQFYFLLALGVLKEFNAIEELSVKDISRIEWNQRLKELIMPGGMGSEFKILIQHKGIEMPHLRCFNYRDFKREVF